MMSDMQFQVGDMVQLTRDIYEEGEDIPPGYIAFKGETVVVRRAENREHNGFERPYAVAHVNMSGSFWVAEDEITKVAEAAVSDV